MSLVASLPGAALLVVSRSRGALRRPTASQRKELPVADRPYTLLSCGMSIDGYLSAGTATRLLLSNDADFDRVDGERAASDAILVGAGTIRKDNPRLLVRSPERRAARVARGLAPSPTKVTVTRRAELDCARRLLRGRRCGQARLLPQPTRSPRPASGSARWRPSSTPAGPSTMRRVCEDLGDRGVRRLMVEGGGTVHTQLLTDDLADELQLVVAPFFVGDSAACRFVGDGRYPWNPGRRATLAEVRQIGDVVLLRYALSPRFGERRDRGDRARAATARDRHRRPRGSAPRCSCRSPSPTASRRRRGSSPSTGSPTGASTSRSVSATGPAARPSSGARPGRRRPGCTASA